MEKVIKHFNWNITGSMSSGRLAISYNGENLKIAQIAGQAPPAYILFYIKAMCPELWEEAQVLHSRRKHQYIVDTYTGRSGRCDWVVRFQRNAELNDCPQGSRIHVSMYGRLNEGVHIWLGDLYPIVNAMHEAGIRPRQLEFSEAKQAQVDPEAWLHPEDEEELPLLSEFLIFRDPRCEITVNPSMGWVYCKTDDKIFNWKLNDTNISVDGIVDDEEFGLFTRESFNEIISPHGLHLNDKFIIEINN